jgi:hypothetical protein
MRILNQIEIFPSKELIFNVFCMQKSISINQSFIFSRFIMPKVLNWILIDSFDNETSLELFLQTHVQRT